MSKGYEELPLFFTNLKVPISSMPTFIQNHVKIQNGEDSTIFLGKIILSWPVISNKKNRCFPSIFL
ncbi:hypothetical protein A9Q84_13845 [Halobacteriovorax marinus]|uniref:Uncharacterized protein n=1 Tax=Halobacteriovorax marinus TaxID=97084 RepID=A0A1Y5F944_9BACT|nr:hypothetical protein A9Q84_13845 [Halobacteriovorax marinus]